jgi:hypothetical protein
MSDTDNGAPDEGAEDPFELFARKLSSVAEAKEATKSTPSRRPVSKLEETVDNYIALVLEEQARRAVAKSELDAYKAYLGAMAKVKATDPEEFAIDLHGETGAIRVTGKPGVRWDQDLLRSLDTGDEPPPELSVTYKPRAAHEDDPVFAPAKKKASTRLSFEITKGTI